jgi:hypothetical protein
VVLFRLPNATAPIVGTAGVTKITHCSCQQHHGLNIMSFRTPLKKVISASKNEGMLCARERAHNIPYPFSFDCPFSEQSFRRNEHEQKEE